jgi:septal ring factor EnvC (AmiA/AmiB activator)
MGEISDAGVHARGLTFETRPNQPIVAPARGRILFAGQFRSYGNIVIIDHGKGWTSLITQIGRLDVRSGDGVTAGQALGTSSAANPNVSVELRHNGQPFAITPLLASG